MSVDGTSMDEAWNVLVKAKLSQVMPSRNIPTGGGSAPKFRRNVRRTENFDDGSRGRIPIAGLGQDSAGLTRSKFGGAARLEEKKLLLEPEMKGLDEPEPKEEETTENFYNPNEKRGPFKRNLAGMDSTIGDLTKGAPEIVPHNLNLIKLAEMRAARDAARAQMGQSNPDRGGDVQPMDLTDSAQKSIQKSYKDLMEKRSAPPDWVMNPQAKHQLRLDRERNMRRSYGEDEFKIPSLTANRPDQRGAIESYFATGKKKDKEWRMPGDEYETQLGTGEKVIHPDDSLDGGSQYEDSFSSNANAGAGIFSPQPAWMGPDSTQAQLGQGQQGQQQYGAKQLKAPEQPLLPAPVATGEPMDLAFRLLKYTRPGRRDRNKDALEAHNQQIDRERKNLGLPRLTEAQRQKMVDENLLGSEVVRLNRAPKIETDGRVPVNVRSAMQEMRRKEMHEKKQDRLEATARRENKVHTRVPYEARTSDRGSGVDMANAASPDEYNIKPSFDPDTANYKKPTTDKINYRDEMKPTNPKSTGKEAGIAMEVHDEARLAEENNAKNWQKLDAETTRGLTDYLEGTSQAGKDRVTRETQEKRNRQTKLNDMALEFAENRGPKGLQNTYNANVELGRRGGYDPNFNYFNSTTDLSNIEGKEGRQQGEATARRIEAAQQAAQAKQIADEIQRRNAASQNNTQENNTGNGEL